MVSRTRDAAAYAAGCFHGCRDALADPRNRMPMWRRMWVLLATMVTVVIPGAWSILRGEHGSLRDARTAVRCECLDEYPDWLRCDSCPRRLLG